MTTETKFPNYKEWLNNHRMLDKKFNKPEFKNSTETKFPTYKEWLSKFPEVDFYVTKESYYHILKNHDEEIKRLKSANEDMIEDIKDLHYVKEKLILINHDSISYIQELIHDKTKIVYDHKLELEQKDEIIKGTINLNSKILHENDHLRDKLKEETELVRKNQEKVNDLTYEVKRLEQLQNNDKEYWEESDYESDRESDDNKEDKKDMYDLLGIIPQNRENSKMCRCV